MIDDSDLKALARRPAPQPSQRAKADALAAAMRAFEDEKARPAQGSVARPRLSTRATNLWSMMMKPRLLTTSALAGLIALPLGGYAAINLLRERPVISAPASVDEKALARKDVPAAPTAFAPTPAAPPIPAPTIVAPTPAAPAAVEAAPAPVPQAAPPQMTQQSVQVPTTPEPMDYVRICQAQGETGCLEAGIRAVPPEIPANADASAKVDVQGGAPADQAPVQAPQAARAVPPPPATPEPGRIQTWTGTETELGTLKTYGETRLVRRHAEPSGSASAPAREPIRLVPAKPVSPAPTAGDQVQELSFGVSARCCEEPAATEPNRNRIETFESNGIKTVAEQPVSTFSIDVDTASYSMVRRSLKDGSLPDPQTVRVEEMINYFPYAWQPPQDASTPFNTTVTVMPTPWNQNTKLMHVAIKGYETPRTTQPPANLVFLIDVSGSMRERDKLPLLQASFRMLVGSLRPDDTVSIVTYAGRSGVALEPTKAADKRKILEAIDGLTAGGSTAGAAGIEEAYRLAQDSFVKEGVNRVMLATDGDFNVGQSSDAELKKLIEEKRQSGVFLSVFGFGQGNLNDRMMQTIAQAGNGQAAYIDTLQEAEKALVQEAGATLFPIAKDVKIQVEFNPAIISEYRLIGYETRALAREDFNNDKVDAGEIGSGHSVTAIYEITPKGSTAQQVDEPRYAGNDRAKAEATAATASGAPDAPDANEYAFLKLRYKLPNEDVSRLITQPVSAANEVRHFADAGEDQRFSVAVAAFGQRLRRDRAVEQFTMQAIQEIAASARGQDLFGYRSEFLTLLRLGEAQELTFGVSTRF